VTHGWDRTVSIARRACLVLSVIAAAAVAGAGPAFAAGQQAADDVGRAAARNPEIWSFLAVVLPIVGAIALAVVGYALIQWYNEEQRKK
jgi:hypothetical protein